MNDEGKPGIRISTGAVVAAVVAVVVLVAALAAVTTWALARSDASTDESETLETFDETPLDEPTDEDDPQAVCVDAVIFWVPEIAEQRDVATVEAVRTFGRSSPEMQAIGDVLPYYTNQMYTDGRAAAAAELGGLASRACEAKLSPTTTRPPTTAPTSSMVQPDPTAPRWETPTEVADAVIAAWLDEDDAMLAAVGDPNIKDVMGPLNPDAHVVECVELDPPEGGAGASDPLVTARCELASPTVYLWIGPGEDGGLLAFDIATTKS